MRQIPPAAAAAAAAGTAPSPRRGPPRPGSPGARLRRGLVYLWAGPSSLLGLAAALLAVASGGRVARAHGVLEVWGGCTGRLLRLTPIRAQAITLGHVVVGRNRACLDRTRSHELGHVRQAERWGPLFFPAYLAASAWAWLRGGHYYHDNWFEQDANRRERRERSESPREGPAGALSE